EVARHHRAQALVVERRRMLVAALCDHSVAVADARVARRAVDVEPFAAAREHAGRHRERERVADRVAVLAGEQELVFLELTAGDRSGYELPRRALVLEERTLFERLVLGGVMHVLAACGRRRGQNQCQSEAAEPATQTSEVRRENLLHESTSDTEAEPRPARKVLTLEASNLGSIASMQTKNRSCDARAKAGTFQTGWYSSGRPLIASMPKTAVSEASRTVVSKTGGMNAGQLNSGRPPMLTG